jgi:hypothetical protein
MTFIIAQRIFASLVLAWAIWYRFGPRIRRSVRLWWATLPRIHWKRSRPTASFQRAPFTPSAAVQNELSERMEQIIDEAFADALQANRDSFNARHGASDMLPPRPKKGDITYAW